MLVLATVLAMVMVLEVRRLRSRVQALAELGSAPDAAGAAGSFRLLVAANVSVSEESERAACAYASQAGLELIDLVPADLPLLETMALAHTVDIETYRANPLHGGRSFGHALLVSTKLLSRAGCEPGESLSQAEIVQLARVLKPYASTSSDLVVVPDLQAAGADPQARLTALNAFAGSRVMGVLTLQGVFLLLLAAGVVVPSAWPAGLVAMVVFHLQPLAVVRGGPLRPRDLLLGCAGRLGLELAAWARLLHAATRARPRGSHDLDAQRMAYAKMMQAGTSAFFEPREECCPLCGSHALVAHLRTRDLLQGKPGRFTLERCEACGHIFQNPRLSEAGLAFYYQDFYDGLGGETAELLFAAGERSCRQRAALAARVAPQPSRWLDVGTGHGHFCAVARQVLPNTRFDGLDLGEGVLEASRRGWIDRAYRGLFPQLALPGRYDVVSMHHYLEHTIDPRAELAAAHRALAPRGLLLIELPRPESLLGRILGRYWVPWFQPQHLHLLSPSNLERLLQEEGFESIALEVDEAHQNVDWLFAAVLLMHRLGPPAEVPWRSSSRWARVRRATAQLLSLPLILVARLLDLTSQPLVRRLGASNTYRMLARRAT